MQEINSTMDFNEMQNSFFELENFVNQRGAKLLNEDLLRLCFIKGINLTENNCEIEKPYLIKGSNGGVMPPSQLLKRNSRVRLDLFFYNDLENYIEFKYHNIGNNDDPNTLFGELMNDFHRLAALADHDSKNKDFYLVYLFNQKMKDAICNTNLDDDIKRFVYGPLAFYEAKKYVSDNNFFWDDVLNKVAPGTIEFRRNSFKSFDCEDNNHKNNSKAAWLPRQGHNYLNNIFYDKPFTGSFLANNQQLTLFVFKVNKLES